MRGLVHLEENLRETTLEMGLAGNKGKETCFFFFFF